MGIEYELYVEAKIDGVWHSIDFYQKTASGKFGLIPIISGKSFLGGALRWEGLLGATLPYQELSEEIRSQFKDYKDPDQWGFFDFWEELGNRDFEKPEFVGFFPNDAIAAFEAGCDEALSAAASEGDYFAPIDFAKLTPEAQRGFRYYEWTEPFGYHDTLRRIKRGVLDRINAYKNELWLNVEGEDPPKFDGPVRVLINIS